MRDDQVVFGIDRRLDVVANDRRARSAGGHGACVGVGHRQLSVGLSFQLFPDLLKLLHALAQLPDLLMYTFSLGW